MLETHFSIVSPLVKTVNFYYCQCFFLVCSVNLLWTHVWSQGFQEVFPSLTSKHLWVKSVCLWCVFTVGPNLSYPWLFFIFTCEVSRSLKIVANILKCLPYELGIRAFTFRWVAVAEWLEESSSNCEGRVTCGSDERREIGGKEHTSKLNTEITKHKNPTNLKTKVY